MPFYLNQTAKNYKDTFNKEKDFYQIWINLCEQHRNLKNIKLKGIDAGELNESEGPDFQGAEFELDGKIYRGDVEVHKNCADWKKHGHHLDQRYDRVVMHLVASKNIYPVHNSKNQKIPSISLLDFPIHTDNNSCMQKCNINISNQIIGSLIFQELALQRMTNKSNNIYGFISEFGIDQSLYIFILKALGNVINKNNYERMAYIIPWKLVHVLKEKNNSPEFWKALYIGAAGLLNARANSVLKMHWKNCLPLIEGNPLKRECWRWGGIRPNNFPQNRLAGLAWFIWQLKKSSIYNVLENLFYKRFSTEKFIKEIFSIFNSGIFKNTQNNYWGRNLILELTGNVFIPMFYKISIINKSFGFQIYLKQLYLELPSSQNYGRLNSLKNQLKINNQITKYFYFNQAILHLQNNYCASNNFFECPIQTIKQKN